jgi:hypothetical protein
MSNETKQWLSDYEFCDICAHPIKGVEEYFVDGKTKMGGVWGLMCPACYVKYGCGIGWGIGQKYNGITGELLEGGYKSSELENEIEGYEP